MKFMRRTAACTHLDYTKKFKHKEGIKKRLDHEIKKKITHL
jgi:hypothetical protein